MNTYTGVFALFAATPIWAIVLVALYVSFAIPIIIANRVSGLFFNYSYSGMIGDIGLLVVILIGATVIQRGEFLPSWLTSAWFQGVWLVSCIAIGIRLGRDNFLLPTATWPDIYHNAISVPLFMFFGMLMFFATIFAGKPYEIQASIALVLIWGILVLYDFVDDRIDQPARLENQFALEFKSDDLESHSLYRTSIVVQDRRLRPQLVRVK